MTNDPQVLPQPPINLNYVYDYSLVGQNSALAVEKGLAEADWYQCEVPRETMRELLARRDGPAIRHTLLWFALILSSGVATYLLRGSWWFILAYAFYCLFYATGADARWHETVHGTAFKTDWMNKAIYEMASFMELRESTLWRWSHIRHHSDTIVVGRDPEIQVPRPPKIRKMIAAFFALDTYIKYFKQITMHSFGHLSAEEKTFIPVSEYHKVFFRARIYVSIYASVIALSIYTRSILPLMYIGFVNVFGTWLMVVHGTTQHAGLAENVLDHRLNCRTVYMNPISRFLYLNMNYHVEHHMFPLIPYHALPKLHAVVKDECPPAYSSIYAAWREIFSAVSKQIKDPTYHIKRKLPTSKSRSTDAIYSSTATPDAEGWVRVCEAKAIRRSEVVRFDHGKKTFAVYRDATSTLYATDGICTHGNTHLADGLVVQPGIIECSKHNGRFNLIDGSPARMPVCRGLATYPVQERNGVLHIDVIHAGGVGARAQKTYQFRVVSNHNVATFIKELVLAPVTDGEKIAFTPGDYLQVNIPAYETIRFSDFDISEPFASVWKAQHVFDLVAHNPNAGRRNNYSLASNQITESTLRFNVRIATPPPGQDCAPGVGSSYIFNLKPGDTVSAIGPFGEFHPKPTLREMIYIGGGAGMAPIRAHLSHLLETQKTARKVSYWYGARSKQEIFYHDYFEQLAKINPNFSFHVALSSPLAEDAWAGHKGFIHEVVLEKHLREHSNASAAEYYLCGPPLMIKACIKMLTECGVPSSQISFDEF